MSEKTAQENLDEAERAYREGNFEDAADWYRKAAELGNALAQNMLGAMHLNGHGVEQSYTDAVKWWRKAAENGHAFSQYNLGLMYEDGRIVERDYCEADKWHRLAAAQGDMGAQRAIERIEEKVTNP